jgi:predicted aldo/keto reductase-like oxidoreductase
MKYRKFGKLDRQVSVLSFGCMRLPTEGGGCSGPNIDQREAIGMIRHAVDQGVNYFDTGWPYHDGNSETLLGQALRDGYRQRVTLATKSPVWFLQSGADFDKFLNQQLQKLETDHIDCYLLHGLDLHRWHEVILKHGVLERAAAAQRDGRIGCLGFSFHDHYESFPQILNGYDDWSFCQIQYNYMDTENQAGTKGLKLAAAKGLAVVVMEPILGGRLATPPPTMQEIMDRAAVRRSPVGWALEWLWDQPEVTTVLSGMSTMAQLEQNLQFAEKATVGSFSAADQQVVAELRRKYQERTVIPCTSCRYCMPCPSGVNIPEVFRLYNDAFLYDDLIGARHKYAFVPGGGQADKCLACLDCEAQCPQRIQISEWMPKIHAALAPAKTV